MTGIRISAHHDRSDERGSITLAAAGFGLVAIAAVAALAGRMVAEHRAVEDSLFEARAYWAAQGHVNYVLSRTRYSGAVTESGQDQPSLVPTALGYLGEIQDLRTWSYPDVSNNYNFVIAPTVVIRASSPRSRSSQT